MDMNTFNDYKNRLSDFIKTFDWTPVCQLGDALNSVWQEDKHVFLCGNGGSAANAIHIANDFLAPVVGNTGKGIRVTALTANQAVLTCLGNDIGYQNIFSFQLETLAVKGDLLIALSGSGNSSNIVNALRAARKIGMLTYAILGYDGGQCLSLSDKIIHFPIKDMQIVEDLQLITGHMLMRALMKNS